MPTRNLSVVQARYRLAQAEDALRRQMGADLDPAYQNLAHRADRDRSSRLGRRDAPRRPRSWPSRKRCAAAPT